jgi:uncharacterized BrkB/YihY/UPF0761 family membrane protein
MAEEEERSGRVARARASAEDLQRRAYSRLERERRRRAWIDRAVDAYEHDRARAGGLLAGGLAYKIFLWQMPFSLLLITALGLASSLTEADSEELAREFGLTAALAGSLAKAAEGSQASRVVILALTLWLTIWAGRGVFGALRLITRLAWGEQRADVSTFVGSLAVSGFATLGIAVHLAVFKGSDALDPNPLFEAVIRLSSYTALFSLMLFLLTRASSPGVRRCLGLPFSPSVFGAYLWPPFITSPTRSIEWTICTDPSASR